MEVRKIARARLDWLAAVLVLGGIVLRLVPHAPNFAPVDALALFAGAVLGWRAAIGVPLFTMMGSDLLIGTYPGMWWTWAACALVGCWGVCLRRTGNAVRIPAGAIGGSIVFFLVSNFGVWAAGGLYPHTWRGLADCYYLALPFFRASMLSDLFYAAVLFGLYTLAARGVRHYRGRRRALNNPGL